VILTARDSLSIRVRVGGASVLATWEAPQGSITVADKNSGEYEIVYKTTVAGTYDLRVTLNGLPVAGNTLNCAP